MLWNPSIVSAGASGAVFGVAGLVAFWYFGKIALPRSIIKRDFVSILTFVGYNSLLVLRKRGWIMRRTSAACWSVWRWAHCCIVRCRRRRLPHDCGSAWIYAGAALILLLVAAFARKTHESLIIT